MLPEMREPYEDRKNAEDCPMRTKAAYDQCVANYLKNYQGIAANPISNFSSVLYFVNGKTKCRLTTLSFLRLF